MIQFNNISLVEIRKDVNAVKVYSALLAFSSQYAYLKSNVILCLHTARRKGEARKRRRREADTRAARRTDEERGGRKPQTYEYYIVLCVSLFACIVFCDILHSILLCSSYE